MTIYYLKQNKTLFFKKTFIFGFTVTVIQICGPILGDKFIISPTRILGVIDPAPVTPHDAGYVYVKQLSGVG